MARTAVRSSKNEARGGVAPKASPAVSVRVRRFSLRPFAKIVDKAAAPPTFPTIAIESEGQAFTWAKNGARVIYTIDRRKHLVRTIEVPPVVLEDASVRRFR
jgi:hypothetical protein